MKAPILISVFLLVGCAAPLQRDDGFAEFAAPTIADPCGPITDVEIPTFTKTERAPDAFDVVVYVAHPDDESVCGGGTLNLLTAAGRNAAVVLMSHGEGGRVVEADATGKMVDNRTKPPSEVATIRDREMALAAQRAGVVLTYLYPAEANADYGFNTSCSETMARWNQDLPGGISGALAKMVDDLRARRPRVVITLDTRNDPGGSGHGHHKVVGALVNLAARLAADPSVPGGRPHVVEELLTFKAKDHPHDITIPVEPGPRMAMVRAHVSQFSPESLKRIAQRREEHFVLQWRAGGVEVPPEGSILESLLNTTPAPAAKPAPATIEILPVVLRDGNIHVMSTETASSWRVPHVAEDHPHKTVANALQSLALPHKVVHSTSWRHLNDELILTYLVVLEPPGTAPEGYQTMQFAAGELLRGEANLPPEQIDVPAVLNHALEHLAWLLREDPAVQKALSKAWKKAVSRYTPKPFLSEPKRRK